MVRRFISDIFAALAPRRGPDAAVPDGQRIYAIGDIHGRRDLLENLLSRIEADDAGRGPALTTLVFLGDLIDRGPQSAQVVDRLIALAEKTDRTRFLLGNHEEVFLKVLAGDLKALAFFNRIGGRETVLSYGISESDYAAVDYPELLELLQAQVPQKHIDFLGGFEDMIELGDYVFVHAGVRPGVPLADQTPQTLRWIRDEFLDHPDLHERIIVHGHSVTDQVDVRKMRIGLDTGAYASGRLTAMGFEGRERWVLQTNDAD